MLKDKYIMNKLEIYDPIYDLLIPEIFPDEKDIMWEPNKFTKYFDTLTNYLITETFELGRLKFLRQAGLNWLVFPSAVHTRFAHSVGSLCIGIMALEHVSVLHSPSPKSKVFREKLKDNIKNHYTDFLLALLLHDIGHLPFSHVLESNKAISEYRAGTVKINHELIAVELIMGENMEYTPKTELYQIAKRKAHNLGVKTVSEVLWDKNIGGLSDPESVGSKKINPNFICALIADEVAETSSKDIMGKNYYLKPLIHGQIDLDRIDHYLRDSFFTGIKLAHFNLIALLRSITIDLTREPPLYLISSYGVPHILQLMFSKAQIWNIALDRSSVRAFESMLDTAFSIGHEKIFNSENDDFNLFFATDDELLFKLRTTSNKVNKENDKATTTLVNKIMFGPPYPLIATVEVPGVTRPHDLIEKNRIAIINKVQINNEDLITHCGKLKPTKETKDNPWWNLKLEGLGEYLNSHPIYGRFCEYIDKEEDAKVNKAKFFINNSLYTDSKKIEEIYKQIDEKFADYKVTKFRLDKTSY